MRNYSTSSIVKIITLILAISIISIFASLYVDWLWFQSIDFESVFTITVLTKVGLYTIVFLLSFLFLYLNLSIVRKNLKPPERPSHTDDGREIFYLNREEPQQSPFTEILTNKNVKWLLIGISIFGALLISSASLDKWLVVQQFFNKVTFGALDPIFNKDISFYLFDLTFYQFIYGTLMFTLILTVLTVGVLYFLNSSSEIFFADFKEFTFAKKHIAVLVSIIFLIQAWGYYLAAYSILYSPSGLVFGATYTDVNAKLLAYRVLLVIVIILALIILFNVFKERLTWVVAGIGVWVAVAIILGSIYPSVIQNMVVNPNEFNRERPYLDNAIEFTRMAYGLDEVERKRFDIDYDLTMEDIENNPATINNIRLWDWEPLTETYRSLQELRTYYVFDNIDIDRYTIDGEYRQVMLSARELEQEDLPDNAKTWINQRLMYTHGYGVTASPVNEVAPDSGFPNFILSDIPPVSTTDLTVNRPEIYFGERTNNDVIVNTEQPEFHYPMGEQNAYTFYEGDKGVKLESFFKQLAVAWTQRDYRILLSSDITNDSQILMNRNIQDRVNKIAPYLRYDRDPYIVISDEGHLYWMWDAYTVTNKFPYSEPFDGNNNNYIRNSVKVVVNAYTGETNFYIADDSDPIIQTYSNIFPDLYKPLSEMPEYLQNHLRYPVDMFNIQAEKYRHFHMTDTQVFYNKEDAWIIPNEISGGQERKMEPYYTIMRLPEEDQEEYILMLPYTPQARPNMTAWMCARMDGDNYGNLLVYDFPRGETVYGPMQIESRINQNTAISQQLALWDQRGSRTFRGNLLVIPIENSILYVEPLYLQAATSEIPELKRVFVAYGNSIVMEPTLDKALERIFGDRERPAPEMPEDMPEDMPEEAIVGDETFESVQDLAQRASRIYEEANQALRQGDWSRYGDRMDELNDVLRRLEETVAY
ncbi:Hypothetical protein SYNTR_0722 [Candidatus Syntrophocurvum alkaliphilum]|uniref:UPF0182 protein SYNTR_0722 n=1 Tax=Candidatus Syntrophocurvum alkaliphilum TaxID=2293317 RepID=A0A6I6D8W6_9FIRM|nr:UPF0182 family protein [Candidatus Syntrophocurvum alkaliphilum]QGT99315.1 Hypothetical protein SYNTR_0722 [Candidatus Syntrophocurvum alkaliphilum]